jgi:NADH:ubiquinone oxidoreductase subunit F (NADH-binding)
VTARLLAGLATGRPLSLDEHLAVHGPIPELDSTALIDAVARAGILGRGGAGFPMARKLGAVAERGGTKVVVANGVEAEPMSAKDRVLLSRAPHLVLDGVAAAAAAVGAREAIVCVPAGVPAVHAAVGDAIRERGSGRRRLRLRIAAVPSRYLAGEETALVRHLNGGPLKPTFTPPRPFERGVGRQPTLVQNVETLAHLALVARHGPSWFREVGGPASPGTMLLTLSGAVRSPGVVEVPGGTPVGDALALGGIDQPVASLVVGGYFGAWLPAPAALSLALDERELTHHGAAVGAGVVVAVPESACGVAELARVMSWLAAQSAHQCGPCSNGLPAIAGALELMAAGRAGTGARERVQRWAGMIRGRGACRHPDGAVRLLSSALRTLGAELRDHERHGPCEACWRQPLLVTPQLEAVAA